MAIGGYCDVERWAIKTMTDREAASVQLKPVAVTLAQLASLRPQRLGARRAGAEKRVVTVEGHIAQVLNESDLDLHVLIFDDAGYTMILECPHPACMSGSRVYAQATRA